MESIQPIITLINLSLRHFTTKKLTDLDFTEDRGLFIFSLVLSTRSRDKMVNKGILKNKQLLDPLRIQRLSLKQVEFGLRPFGLRMKAKAIKCLVDKVLEMDDIMEDQNGSNLQNIYGIGTKIVKVFNNVALNKLTIAVDTHTKQIFNKIYQTNGSISRVDGYLDKNVDGILYRKWCHIILVRGNKRNQGCDVYKCKYCKRVSSIIPFMGKL